VQVRAVEMGIWAKMKGVLAALGRLCLC
jgi:hypothetical protein